MFLRFGLFLVAGVFAAPIASDPCAAIAGTMFAAPADMRACLRSFPFNETLRQNILSTVSRIIDFYTFEDYYPKFTHPFPNNIDIRAELFRINSTSYDTDYDFNLDLYNSINRLNDGHTSWLPNCYVTWEALLPTPIVSIYVDGVEGVYIAHDVTDLIPPNFTSFYNSIGLDLQRFAGARVLRIEGMDPYDYVDWVADTVTGNYLDHGVRVNSVFTGYRLVGSSFSQRFGDLAGRLFNPIENLTFQLVPDGANHSETVTVPFLNVFTGNNFSDQDSYWANNCAADRSTNGVDRRKSTSDTLRSYTTLRAKGITRLTSDAVGLPSKYQPKLSQVNSNASDMVSYLLPDGITGVLFVGSFKTDNFEQFQVDVVTTITSLKAAGATQLLIDLTSNPGGFICEGLFLHQYLSGLEFGYPGFRSTVRANPLAQKIVSQVIAQGISESTSFYAPNQWAFVNDTLFPNYFNYMDPSVPVNVNGRQDATSVRLHDTCPFSVSVPSLPPFDPTSMVAIVTNGNCGSTCALFITLMKERHNTTIAVFGGRRGQSIEFKGMAGNQVLEWKDLDSEIKTAGFKNDPLAPPDLLVSANMRHNWRTAYSYLKEDTPIAYYSESPTLRFPYTIDTYNNPENLWIFAAREIFG